MNLKEDDVTEGAKAKPLDIVRKRTKLIPRVRRWTPFFLAAFSLVILFDQITKWLAIHQLDNSGLPIIGRVVENTGIAFGAFAGLSWLTLPIALLVTSAVFLYYMQHRGIDNWTDTALGMLIGGAVSNLFDRFVHGHVIDFIDLKHWPVFNLADSSITAAVAIIIWRSFRSEKTVKSANP